MRIVGSTLLLVAVATAAPLATAPTEVETPDYADPDLRRALRDYIRALGARYDGDPRIGFVTAGLLGAWGKWHTYPREVLFASKAVQAEVLDAYEAAFRTTPVLLRYPAGEGDETHAPNAGRRFGYHDDSFAWGTLATGRDDDDWFYMALLRKAGPAALDAWMSRPIGGEIRPEAWGRVFDDDPGLPAIQDFRRCVAATHVTWLMDSGMFEERPARARRDRAEAQVRRMGYEFHVPAATLAVDRPGVRLEVAVEIENRGVAPFYYDWPAEYALIGADGAVSKAVAGRGKLVGLLPGDPPRRWADAIGLDGVAPGRYTVALRVANPLPNGHPLRFANADQDKDRPGWLSLGVVDRP